jgi:hypothetical protein
MTKIARTPIHRNATVLFDGGQLKADPAAKRARAQFGRGILRSRPHDKRPYNAADLAEFAALLATGPARASTPSADLAKHGIKPVRGGAPAKFEPTDQDWADFYGWTDEPAQRVAADDDMLHLNACG